MDAAEFGRVFGLPFDEATAWFRAKLTIPTARWDELNAAAHARAFTSAGAYHADLLNALRQMTDKAIAGAMDIREFRKQFKPLVGRYGWQLKGGGPAWRSDLIWRTNITTAYQAGRWQQFEEAGIDFLKYVHNDSVMRPRPNHVAMNGITLPRTDQFWSVNYPPNGFGCHCRAVAATRSEYIGADPGLKVRPDNWRELPDKGWDHNVGASEGSGYRALTTKVETLPNDIARAWVRKMVQEEPAFERFVAGRIDGDFPVAVLKPEDMAAISAVSQSVWMSQETLLAHLRKHPEIGLAEYRMIPEIIDEGEVYRQGETRLVLLRRKGKLYRAALKRTKDGRDNFFLTLFTTDQDTADRDVAQKFERIR